MDTIKSISQDGKTVTLTPATLPAKTVNASQYLQILTNQQTALQAQLDAVTASIKQLTDANVALPPQPQPLPPTPAPLQ